jgi:pantoate--beta-alanine ligase
MGALHAGHAALLRQSVSENRHTTLSIFVNPTQFGPKEDYSRYPRTLDSDLELAESCGVDTVFVPGAEEMYPHRWVNVQVGGVTERWEGAHRVGHFDGVATVVAKLFHIVRPNVAYFGQKDLQQCQVIRLMVEGLNIPLNLKFCPTVRESDGLAMSSRNRYLSEDDRKVAPLLYEKLSEAQSQILNGKSPESVLNLARKELVSAGFFLDYFAYVDLPEMKELSTYAEKSALIIAAKLGNTRLIDNVVFIAGHEKSQDTPSIS